MSHRVVVKVLDRHARLPLADGVKTRARDSLPVYVGNSETTVGSPPPTGIHKADYDPLFIAHAGAHAAGTDCVKTQTRNPKQKILPEACRMPPTLHPMLVHPSSCKDLR